MAILRQPAQAGDSSPAERRERAKQGGLLALLALSCLAGCMLVDALVEPQKPFAFPHRLHVEQEEIECAVCHAGWEDSDDPGMPRQAVCALCHDDIDQEKPAELHVATLFVDDQFRAVHAGRQSSEIVFDHQAHAGRGLDCTACHAAVVQDEGALAERGAALRMSMEGCIDCHVASSGPKAPECAACHVEIRSDVAPPSHHGDWTQFHGMVVRARSEERNDNCALCHEPSTCEECHHVELPENHTNYWRRRGHGLTASMDRDSCATCHDSDSCRRCHEELRPQSHTGNWGDPVDRHCLGCHEPLRSSSCGVCHSGTPSHELATPLPPDHNPGMNCRMCHGNGQPLPHQDNGQTCTSCHM